MKLRVTTPVLMSLTVMSPVPTLALVALEPALGSESRLARPVLIATPISIR